VPPNFGIKYNFICLFTSPLHLRVPQIVIFGMLGLRVTLNLKRLKNTALVYSHDFSH